MPFGPWQAVQAAALAAPAAASPCIGAWLRKSSNCGGAASATPTAMVNVIEATIAARVVKITATSSQFHVEHHADQVDAVMRPRAEVGVDPGRSPGCPADREIGRASCRERV